MSDRIAQFDAAESPGDEVLELAVIHLEGRLTDRQRDRLNTLLATDAGNRDRFVALCAHASILASCVGTDEGQEESAHAGSAYGSRDRESGGDAPVESSVGAAVNLPCHYDSKSEYSCPPFPSLSTTHHPLPTNFTDGPVFSYMVATVVLCVMVLSAWAYKITHSDGEFVNNPKPAVAPMDQVEFVGRITGMADCRWANPDLRPYAGSYVPLGRKYELTSGLLEITYASGARVILEGPCTYKVDSKIGGYLKLGKLTARVETKAEGGRRKAEDGRMKGEGGRRKGSISDPLATSHQPLATAPSFLIPHPSSFFSVTTPTAIVTDLGTEFGVEVNKNGGTTSHVFRGSIKVTALDCNGEKQGDSLILVENESVRIEPTDDKMPIPRRVAGNPDIFTRQMPEPPPVILFCDTFGNLTDSSTYGFADRYGLNKELLERQSGTCRPVSYVRGGDYEESQAMVQVGHAVCPGKLSLFADHEQAGWVTLNRNFPRNVEVSVDLDPDALRCVDKSRVPRTLPADSNNNNWLALGIRCQGIWLDHRELPLASNSGTVFQIRSNGKWTYFENGKAISKGQVSHAHLYHVVMCVSNNLVNIHLNGCAIDLDVNAPGTARTLQGPLSKTNDNFISIGVCCEDAVAPAGGTDLNSVDNLTVRTPSRENEKQDPRKLN